ncbi:hypothetical protein KMB89_gp12 [Citrobacter phage HCF1]|uniref:Uncharacterized protein n=1 Tax=Citrobacter phage HCF1 TaxID=2849700 RepID=A0ABX6D3I7_9CAUD|nr:hypothetical protein KMB89_gp12 [Citrobacter phage HCF1]
MLKQSPSNGAYLMQRNNKEIAMKVFITVLRHLVLITLLTMAGW